MDLADLAERLAEDEIPHMAIRHDLPDVAPHALLVAKTLMALAIAIDGDDDELKEHIDRVLGIRR